MDMTHVMRTILVAGGAGFIGSHLCDALLAQGHKVICVDNLQTGRRDNLSGLLGHPNFRLIKADVERLPEIDDRLDRIYNLASPASPPAYQADPVRTMMTNVVGTNNLLALAEKKGARLLQASTSEVYGDPEVHPQPEGYAGHVNCVGPRACYDEGKRAAEALCYDYLRAERAEVRVARIFNTYGPHMQCDDGRIVSNFICQALSDEPMTIYGSGEQTRSFCYVTDMIDGLMALMELAETPDGPVNIGNPGEYTSPRTGRADPAGGAHQRTSRLPPLAEGRPQAPAARHHARQGAARMGTTGAAGGGVREHGLLVLAGAAAAGGRLLVAPHLRRRMRRR